MNTYTIKPLKWKNLWVAGEFWGYSADSAGSTYRLLKTDYIDKIQYWEVELMPLGWSEGTVHVATSLEDAKKAANQLHAKSMKKMLSKVKK